jgi:uncharacterized OB-fold protein
VNAGARIWTGFPVPARRRSIPIRFATNIIDCDPEQVEIGMPVEVVFDHVNEDTTLVKFKPAS